MRKCINFGFYKGLGDFITDAHIIQVFIRNGFQVNVFVSRWLKKIAEAVLPAAEIIFYDDWKDIRIFKYEHKYVFLTPNYLHPASLEKRAVPLYLAKVAIVKSNAVKSEVIHSPLKELFFYYFQIKKTSLDEHFYLMSLSLIKRYFPDLKFKTLEWNSSQKPKINRIIIFPFSGNRKKDYSLSKYIYISRVLKFKYGIEDINFLVTKKDLPLLKEASSEFNVLTLSLVDIAKMIGKNDLVISGDTGPAHLSAYYGANLVVLYGYTKPEKYKPLGDGKILTINSSNGIVKDIPADEILRIIENEFILERSKNDKSSIINMYPNLQ